MAKRKNKRAPKFNTKILVLVAIICGVLAIACAALSFVHYESVIELLGTKTTTVGNYTGFLEMFGTGTESEDAVVIGTITSVSSLGTFTSDLKTTIIANPNVLIAAICVVVAIVCVVLSVFMKKKLAPIFKAVAAFAFVAAFVFGVMTMGKFFEINEVAEDAQKYYKAGIGLIGFEVLTCVGFLGMGANLVLDR